MNQPNIPDQNKPNTKNGSLSIDRIKSWYRALPDKKRYIEFVTALLTVPVLITVLISNFNSLKNNEKSFLTPTPTQKLSDEKPTAIIVQKPTSIINTTNTHTPTPSFQCIPGVGQVDILEPNENANVTSNPICLNIQNDNKNYCSVVWAYRINGSSWSDYTDKNICMYGLTPGTKNLELKIKSIVNGEEKVLKRTFVIEDTAPTPTQSQSTQSAILSP